MFLEKTPKNKFFAYFSHSRDFFVIYKSFWTKRKIGKSAGDIKKN